MLPDDPKGRLRLLLGAIFVLGLSGSAAELMLLAHYEDFRQLIPLILIGTALLLLALHAVWPRPLTIRALQGLMGLFVAAGVAGVVLHLRSTMEFQLELDPSLQGLALLSKALRAKAPPALAPGVMVQLGLIGLAFAYRHPATAAPGSDSPLTPKERS